jgi:heavy metal sensor kinase
MKNFFPRLISLTHSIRFRLMLWYTAILALVLAVFSAFVFYSQLRDIRGESIYRLQHKMEEVVAAINNDRPNPLMKSDVFILLTADGHIAASQGVEDEQDALAVFDQAKEALAENERNGPIPTWNTERGEPETHYVFGYQTLADSSGRLVGAVIIGSPADPYDLRTRLLFTLALGSLLTLSIAAGGGWWLAARAMRPVHTITATAQSISESDLSRRINIKTRDELGELANTFDAMLERLEAAFKRQRQFVADASHELRTPLTIVNLETGRALENKRTTDEYKRALGVIRSENEFMTRLVNDLLILARLDAGQETLKHDALDLSDIALDAVERLAPLAERNHVTLETGDLPEAPMTGDRQALLQMLSNLVENGIKYAGGSDRRVKVETGQSDESVWARVSDNGPGIPADHLPHIFDRFYRVDQARARNDDDDAPNGSGLGLAIVQMIVQAHHGEIKVGSEPGQGTTFEVKFPLA